MKLCPMCKINKPYSEYHKSSATKDGVQGHCKECKKILGKRYEKTRSKEKKREYARKEWLRKKNDPNYLEKHRQWIENNKEYVRDKAKEYRKNKGVLLLYTRSNQRASRAGYEGRLKMYEWEAVLNQTRFLCIACEEKPADSIDHVIPLSCGGTNTYDNIQPMCIRCNLKKGSRSVDFRNSEFIKAVEEACRKR